MFRTLLGLEAEPPGLLRAGGPRDADELVQLAVLPGSHAEQEAHDIALLLAVDLLHVFVSPHGAAFSGPGKKKIISQNIFIKKIIYRKPFNPHKLLTFSICYNMQ